MQLRTTNGYGLWSVLLCDPELRQTMGAPAAVTLSNTTRFRIRPTNSQVHCAKPARIGRRAKQGMHRLSKSRLAMLGFVALLPSFLKRPCYRLFFGYQIGKRVRIGLSIIDARECTIDDDVTIGHLNVVIRLKKLEIGDHVKIGHLNIIRGGDEVIVGTLRRDYSDE